MGIKDLFITPIYIIIFILVAYFIRPYVTNKQTRKYFLPALWIRFAGAIALGLIYQFYYGGGDTFNYFIHGSRWIWQAFLDDPILGLELLLDNGGGRRPMETYHYSKYIWYYKDSKSFTIVRLSGLFGLFTLHTYSSIALFFATFSFSGLWALYSAVQKMYPSSRYLHLAVLFVPSVIFWGSGILKDTITLGALGWLTWAMIYLLIFDRKKVLAITIVFLTILMILKIKSYIVLCFVPMVFVYLYSRYLSKIKNILARILVAPLLIVVIGSLGVLALSYASTEEYNLNNVAERAAITAYDIRYGWGSRTGGDGGYDIGIPDGSISGMLSLAPKAITVSLFRPFLWEVRNPLMLLAALESTLIVVLTFMLIFSGRWRSVAKDPFLFFCICFALLFAFAVGISSGNFGTLLRYKIPILPFYFIAMTAR